MPEISVLISTRNRAHLVGPMLDKIHAQRPEGLSLELIVVDNGSSDRTSQVLANAARRMPLRALYEPIPGKSLALNSALEAATGDLLIFTDDDIEHSPRWIAELHRASVRWPAYSIFCGPIRPVHPQGPPEWLPVDHLFASAAFAKFEPAKIEGPLRPDVIPFGANFAVRSRDLKGMKFNSKLGPRGRQSTLGEETEFLHRLMQQGGRVVYVPTAEVNHGIEGKQYRLGWLHRRAFQLGRGVARISPDRRADLLWGVPRPLWRKLIRGALQYLWRGFRGKRANFLTGSEFHYCRGQVHEHRILSAEQKRRARGVASTIDSQIEAGN